LVLRFFFGMCLAVGFLSSSAQEIPVVSASRMASPRRKLFRGQEALTPLLAEGLDMGCRVVAAL
jgi:hypothetical protein